MLTCFEIVYIGIHDFASVPPHWTLGTRSPHQKLHVLDVVADGKRSGDAWQEMGAPRRNRGSKPGTVQTAPSTWALLRWYPFIPYRGSWFFSTTEAVIMDDAPAVPPGDMGGMDDRGALADVLH
ncbi:unnamed protein product [Calypogeia fissa]